MGSEINRIGVIGAGGWGTALANLLAGKDYSVDLWVREEEVFKQIKEDRENKMFLPGGELDARLNPVKTYDEALANKDLILMVVPSHVYRDVLTGLKPFLKPGMALMTATKGIENDSLKIMSQVTEDLLDETFAKNFACLAGPSFAKEVVRMFPTAVTIGSRNLEHAENLQRVFSSDYFRAYASEDLVGVQVCGALKNVIAIAAGAADGMSYGHNARAALITRGLAEIARLGVAMGANPHTFAGLAGMGDLVLTCTGDLSRNRTVGLKIGSGKTLKEITSGMNMVAEGIKTTISAYELGKKMGVDMPITEQIYEVLYNDKEPKEAVRALMGRSLKQEREH